MGVGSGYTQKDVQELARILTGVGVNLTPNAAQAEAASCQPPYVRDGLFEFNPNRHDFGDKVFLGHAIQGRGLGRGRAGARHPRPRARHRPLRLAASWRAYFVGDDPPPPWSTRMAATFQRTDGDIAAVLRTMFHSPEFDASLGSKFKDPVHYAVSAVRLAYDDRSILNTGPMQGWLNRMAEGLYSHETPDGYPMIAAAWNGPGQMAVRFEIARQIGSGSAGLFKPDGPRRSTSRPSRRSQNALYYQGLRQTLGRARPRPRSTRPPRRRTGTPCSCPRPNSCADEEPAHESPRSARSRMRPPLAPR